MSAPLTGQAICTSTTTGIVLSATAISCQAWTVKALRGNSGTVYIGGSTVTNSNGYALEPGDSFDYELSDQLANARYPLRPQDLYVAGNSGDTVTWFASPTA